MSAVARTIYEKLRRGEAHALDPEMVTMVVPHLIALAQGRLDLRIRVEGGTATLSLSAPTQPMRDN